MSTQRERSRSLALRTVHAMSVAAMLALLNGCVVQERVYGPPPEDSPPPPEYTPPPNEYPPAPQQYPPASQQYPPASQEYPPAAPSYGYAQAQVEIRTTEAPPPLPDYEQPPCPEPGYLWTPGYWGYGDEGYFWVPGTWVMPPHSGVLGLGRRRVSVSRRLLGSARRVLRRSPLRRRLYGRRF
jgi:WXXGXW repeat (2 copies)